MGFGNLFFQARRRRVFRTAALYVVSAWLLLQIADMAFPALSIPEESIRFVWIAVILAFPVAIAFGWRYDIEGGRIVRTSDAEDDNVPISLQRPDYLVLGALGIVAMAIVVGSLSEISGTQKPVAPSSSIEHIDPASILVLPFVAVTAESDDEYLADGISEVLIHQLSNIQELKVIARTTSFMFKGQNMDVREIGRELGVAAILMGSVQRSKDRLRITAQLIDSRSGTAYWSEEFDRRDDDIFAIQDEIATRAVEKLPAVLLARNPASRVGGIGTDNREAYEEYLKGLEQLRIGSVESLPRALDHFARAIELDDGYNQARVGQLHTYHAQNLIFQISYAELQVRNQAIPREILQRDPDSAHAKNALAVADFSLHFPTGSGEAERLWNEALKTAPNDPWILMSYAYYLEWNDRPQEAIKILHRALEFDPLEPTVLANAARLGDLAHAQTLREKVPENAAGWAVAGEAYLRRGDLAQSLDFFRIAEEKSPQDPEFPAFMAMIYLTVGLMDEAEAAVRRAEAVSPTAPVTVASRIGLTYRQEGLEPAGEMALAALRNALPARQFSPTVIYNLALQYALYTNTPERFIEAYAMSFGAPGMGGAGNFRQRPVASTADYLFLDQMMPALRAAGETATAEQIFSRLNAFFDNASDTLRHHETRYRLQLFSGDIAAALDTLEEIIDDGRGGIIPSWSTSLSELRWWLEFDGVMAEPLKSSPRYAEILEKRRLHVARERQAILALIKNEAEATTS
jgi:TolB-like protein/Flp pilus assembly protein TadD